MKGILYLVATPIGNLSDITYRAVETLKSVDLIAAEDTRQTLKLLNHFEISKPLISYYRHNEDIKSEKIIKELLNGKNIALVSDAGTPGISDPGEELVKNAIENNINIVPIPGACAFVNALIISGINTKEFVFYGFLPMNKKNRKEKLEEISKENKTVILYKFTHKIRNTYRNSEELIKIASEFILKNKYQLRKELTSFKHIDYPLQVIYFNDLKSTILKVLDKLDKGSIFILGRNNNDINLILSDLLVVDNDKIVYKKRKDLVINYLTIHKSKGLEADNVIVINFFNSVLGFPNQIKEERIMRLVTKKAEDYPYSEERRLFYVAITRTRNRCYLLVPSNNYSIFIKELERKKSLVKFVRMR